MDCVCTVFQVFLSPVAEIMIEEVKCTFQTDDNMNALHEAISNLAIKRTDRARQLEIEELKDHVPTNEVLAWMAQVDALEKQVTNIQEKYEQRSPSFGGNCNFFANYVTSKEAFKKLADVRELCVQEEKFKIITTARLPLPCLPQPGEPTISPTDNVNIELVRDYINDDSVGIIGIWGMGGVGKTHMLLQIQRDYFASLGQTEKPIFNRIVFVTVSKGYSVEQIQRDIAGQLKLEQGDNDIKISRDRISNFLGKRTFLLLLDDVWERVDLQIVGIPFPLRSKQKVILTTRNNRVCGQMDANREIKVGCLNEKDAWRLFEDKVGVDTIKSDPDIVHHARELVAELDGLPLALITVGRAMHGKKNSRLWEQNVKLAKASRLPEIEECETGQSMFHKMKISYDSLKSDAMRQCFLTCSLWPDDYNIEKEDLIRFWMGLGIINELGIEQDIYNQGYALIDDLQAACLLEVCEDLDRVKMHDMVRDMALWIACDCGKENNKWIVKKKVHGDSLLLDKDIWSKTEYIALWNHSNTDTNVVVPYVTSPTNLKALITRALYVNLDYAHRYPALAFLDLSRNMLVHFPEIICKLVNLKYLNLSDNYIKDLPKDLKLLINLKYLILRNNKINKVPDYVISELKELIMLDLFVNKPSDIGLRSVLKDLESLGKIKALGIKVSSNSELEQLSNLENVTVRSVSINYGYKGDNSLFITNRILGNNNIRKSLVELTFYSCRSLEQFVFENKEGRTDWQFQNLKKLQFTRMGTNLCIKGVDPKHLFPRLSHLEFDRCTSLNNLLWTLYLPCLRELKIHDNVDIAELFAIEGGNGENFEIEETSRGITNNQTFPSLEVLDLSFLGELTSICSPRITFPSLKHLIISYCPKLCKLPFERNTVPINLKVIATNKECWEQIEWEDDHVKSSLQKLFQKYRDFRRTKRK